MRQLSFCSVDMNFIALPVHISLKIGICCSSGKNYLLIAVWGFVSLGSTHCDRVFLFSEVHL